MGGNLADSLIDSFSILNGERSSKSDMTALNAGLGLLASGKAGTLGECVELAIQTLKSGKPLDKLKLLVKASGGNPEIMEEVERGHTKRDS